MATPDWPAIQALAKAPLTQLFAEDADRLASLSLDVAGIHFDWSKTHLTRRGRRALFEKSPRRWGWRRSATRCSRAMPST